jgi:hypothetical protein
MKTTCNPAVLKKFWLTRLQEEYDQICLDYRLQLEPPIFEISEGKKQLGCWNAATRSLRMSQYLIMSYPWSVTLQVLKHEMAHQYSSEVLGQTAAHGEGFQAACALLGVLPQYRGCRIVTAEILARLTRPEKNLSEGQKVLARIEKLLALGESSNVHEAEAALKKASLLIEKYHLQQLVSSEHSAYVVCLIEIGKKQIATYQRHICRILQDFFFVRVVLSETYKPLTNEVQKAIELLGTSENVAIAEYCCHFLENRLALLWQEYRLRNKSSGRTQKNSFYLGVVLGFWEKLQEQNSGGARANIASAEHRELLVVEDRRLETFVQSHFPRLRKTSSRRSTVDRKVYQEGMQAGRSLRMTEGVTQGSGRNRFLE